MIDLLFVSWNRKIYTQHSFRALLSNTAWEYVAKLVLCDDASTDGTREWLKDQIFENPLLFDPTQGNVSVEFLPAPFGGPVAAVNRYLEDHRSPGIDVFGKADNDTMFPAGWLPELLGLLERYPDIDLLGMAPDIGPPRACPYPERTVRYAPWVDGNGLWRHRTFDGKPLPVPGHSNGRFGFSEWQGNHAEVVKAWAAPDLPVFQLDLLPFEPWLTLAAEYRANRWQRDWPPHDPNATEYWSWFTDSLAVA